MTALKSLLIKAAKRLATDPDAQAKAAAAARRAKPAVDAALKEAKAIREAPDRAREAGRLAGRLKRKYLDAADTD